MRRICQPEIKLCNTAIIFKGTDGKDVMVRAAQDANEKMVSRDICTFNVYGDIRQCFNWDTSVTSKEMKNAAGDWLAVGSP